MYLEDGHIYVVIGSNAGQSRHPAWLLNLQSDLHPSYPAPKRKRDPKGRGGFALMALLSDELELFPCRSTNSRLELIAMEMTNVRQ